MKITLIGAATILGLLATSRAEAGEILYSTTDLGSSYTLESNATQEPYDVSKPYYGVANSNGSVVYAFDKSPVTYFSSDPTTVLTNDNDYLQVETMQNGSHMASYIDAVSGQVNLRYPSFLGFNGGWAIEVGDSAFSSPISDINSQGQIVGTSQFGSGTGKLGTGASYAMFSTVGGQTHVLGGDAFVVDNLNNYIATIPGVTLTSAVEIDDLGRIIAKGSNGDDYLLTPTSLGSPATVPEPTTATLLGFSGALLAVRSIGRRWNR